MPDITASLEFLADLPLYQHEKPYLALLLPSAKRELDKERLDNLEFETHHGLPVADVREKPGFTIEECGFEILNHTSQHMVFSNVDDVEAHKRETEVLLCKKFGAVHTSCYHLRLRKNDIVQRTEFDVNDPLLIEGPAKGVHNDITFGSGPSTIGRYLQVEDQVRFLKPGYRIRIINTWRTINRIAEDRPLALCDSRSIDSRDLIAADRILPDRIGEIYYLRFNPNQHWCWVEKQTSSELYAFVMYDTKPGKHARSCPHASFANSRASPDAPPRYSVETRSIVISKE